MISCLLRASSIVQMRSSNHSVRYERTNAKPAGGESLPAGFARLKAKRSATYQGRSSREPAKPVTDFYSFRRKLIKSVTGYERWCTNGERNHRNPHRRFPRNGIAGASQADGQPRPQPWHPVRSCTRQLGQSGRGHAALGKNIPIIPANTRLAELRHQARANLLLQFRRRSPSPLRGLYYR